MLKEDIEKFIRDKIGTRKSKNLERDIEVVLYYFGFSEQKIPTLEETNEKFGIGTRERVRQIVRDRFSSHLEATELDSPRWSSLKTVYKQITSSLFLKEEDLFKNSEYINKDDCSIKGLFNILDIFLEKKNGATTLTKQYEFVNTQFSIPKREDIKNNVPLSIISIKFKQQINLILKTLRTAPGQKGVANFDEEFTLAIRKLKKKKQIDTNDELLYKVSYFFLSNDQACTLLSDKKSYSYIGRDNIIVNSLEKIFFFEEDLSLNAILAGIMQNLRKRIKKDLVDNQRDLLKELLLLMTDHLHLNKATETYFPKFKRDNEHFVVNREKYIYFLVKRNPGITYPEIKKAVAKNNKDTENEEDKIDAPYLLKLLKSPFIFGYKEEGKTIKYYVLNRYDRIVGIH